MTIAFLYRRLTRGAGRGEKRIAGKPGQRIKLEMPIEMVRYAAAFAPRTGLFGSSRRSVIGSKWRPAITFATRCDQVAKARRGRPHLLDRLDSEANRSDRQFYRREKRARELEAIRDSFEASARRATKPTE
ncbi:hypothetical protein [Altererythrobacter sp. C41]|uniref:hypothetical protein n=1 Tax=Altererythrobacter sp. C41 TaxID=2806021 RepID=UPI001932E474|nr:hypothetical protein [Altererythrobacter sp. C41]MBM0169688.1 hypothetical protein [Altererythrobacter sp. C41]